MSKILASSQLGKGIDDLETGDVFEVVHIARHQRQVVE
jgi:hypothetical protein